MITITVILYQAMDADPTIRVFNCNMSQELIDHYLGNKGGQEGEVIEFHTVELYADFGEVVHKCRFVRGGPVPQPKWEETATEYAQNFTNAELRMHYRCLIDSPKGLSRQELIAALRGS